MEIPTELIVVAATGAGGLLINSAIQLRGIATKLTDHILAEVKTDQETHGRLKFMSNRLRKVELRLPNGEVDLMYKMTKELYRSCKNGEMGTLGIEMERNEKNIKEERALAKLEGAEYDDYV